MKKILFILIASWTVVSCSGPSYFSRPKDFVGGNRSAAVETHCANKAGEGKDNMVYKLCEQSYNTHYGN
mgnify:CR=1 FL=1